MKMRVFNVFRLSQFSLKKFTFWSYLSPTCIHWKLHGSVIISSINIMIVIITIIKHQASPSRFDLAHQNTKQAEHKKINFAKLMKRTASRCVANGIVIAIQGRNGDEENENTFFCWSKKGKNDRTGYNENEYRVMYYSCFSCCQPVG